MEDVLWCNLLSWLPVWKKWEKAWTNSRKVEIGQSHHEGLAFEACSRSAKLFSVLNYIGWNFYQSPIYPPSTGSDTWTPEIDTRSRLGTPNSIFVKYKVWFFSSDDFEHTVWAFWIYTLFWPEVAHLTGSCWKRWRRVQDFINFSRSWWLYVSFKLLVLLNGVLKSHLDALRVVSVILKVWAQKVKRSCTELTKIKTRLFQNSLEIEVKFLSRKSSKAQH